MGRRPPPSRVGRFCTFMRLVRLLGSPAHGIFALASPQPLCYLDSPPQLMGFSNECRDCVVCPLKADDKIAGFPDTGPRKSVVPIQETNSTNSLDRTLLYLNIKFPVLGIKPILDTRSMMMHGRQG